MKTIFIFLFLVPLFCFSQEPEFAGYVDPFIGTGGHGHTYPGPVVPFGMVQLGPDTRLEGWDGCGGYHYSDSVIYGFSHTHLSGTGCSDYGDILVMPMAGEPSVSRKLYSSPFSHKNEKAGAGHYSVLLDKGNILAELTSTCRVGFHKYTFNNSTKSNIIFDLQHRDKVLESSIKIVSPTQIEGMRRSDAWARDQHVYFVAEFSKPFVLWGIAEDEKINNVIKEAKGKNIKAWFQFATVKGESIFIKVGISAVSIEGARKNLKAELPGWDFEKTKNNAIGLWNKELGKIEVKGTPEQMKIFYTALYHTMVVPNVFMDVDSMYRGRDLKIHKADGFTNYSVFSLWDTFRGLHPLFTLIQQQRTIDFIRTFLVQYTQGGRLPVWELAGNETDCMIGYHAVPVIADALSKGINKFDVPLAFEAMKKSATMPHLGLPALMDHGFISSEEEHESVSKTLEYAYDDWCIALTAKILDKQDDYKTYISRAQYYKNLFDGSTKFFRARKNGGWYAPFDPFEVNTNYTEANAWQYRFFVPQDITGLMSLSGGKEKFAAELDKMFSATDKTTGRDQADITGMIGQYAHGNEPSHHMAYLYNFAGQPWKTQQLVHQILTDFYKAAPDGLIGNEDCGQMSAWYVLSAMGFYSVTPGLPYYTIGTPMFSEVIIHLENKKQFVIKANNLTADNYYIRSARLNNALYNKSWISHEEIMNGGTLRFEMGSVPEKYWGAGDVDIPVAGISDNLIVPVPLIISEGKTFSDKTTIRFQNAYGNFKIFYTTDGTKPSAKSLSGLSPATIDTNTVIKAIAIDNNGKESFVATGHFFKRPDNRTIRLLTKYSPQYTAGGDNGVIDGMRADLNWRKGDWQGYQGTDFEAVVDLGKIRTIKKIGAGFLQDSRAWILMPKKVEFWLSADGKDFSPAGTIVNIVPDIDFNVQMKDFIKELSPTDVQYVKVKAVNFGKLPGWHESAGNDAWLFIDEIIIE